MNNDHKNHSAIDEKPTLGPVKEEVKEELQEADDHLSYDPQYDEEVNRLLDEVKEEFFLFENPETLTEKQDFLEDNNHAEPKGYQEVLRSKIEKTNERLKFLSRRVCKACPSARDHISRIEQDHGTTFCKMDYPRHPPWDKPWRNHWKFKTIIQCKEFDEPKHVHTIKCCGTILLELQNTRVTEIPNLPHQAEYPKHVVDAAQFFQDFAREIDEKFSISYCMEANNTLSDKHMWTSITFDVKSNYLNEIAIVIRGNKISPMIPHFERFFQANREKIPNAVAVICYDTSWTKQKVTERLPEMPVIITGDLFLKDKVGPILVQYSSPKSLLNPVEIIQLSEVIQDYTGLTKETTLLEIGCKSGVLSLTMAHKCEKIIGLNTRRNINRAEDLKKSNKIFNVSFIRCEPKDVLGKCWPLINGCVAVAVLNLSSPYGKSSQVMQALRDIPSIWRVIIYGSFVGEFHENISVLTRENHSMGERYLPMQGCILDKSPSNKDVFDIVIAFERKSLVQPKIELLAPGPTLNVNFESRSSQSLADNNEVEDMDISPLSQNSDNTEMSIKNSEDLSDRIARFSPILENVSTADGFEFSITANATFFGLKVNAKSKENEMERKIRVKAVGELMQAEIVDKQLEEDLALLAKCRELIQAYFREREERMNQNRPA